MGARMMPALGLAAQGPGVPAGMGESGKEG